MKQIFITKIPAAVADNNAKNKEVLEESKEGGGRLELIHNSDHMKEFVWVKWWMGESKVEEMFETK